MTVRGALTAAAAVVITAVVVAATAAAAAAAPLLMQQQQLMLLRAQCSQVSSWCHTQTDHHPNQQLGQRRRLQPRQHRRRHHHQTVCRSASRLPAASYRQRRMVLVTVRPTGGIWLVAAYRCCEQKRGCTRCRRRLRRVVQWQLYSQKVLASSHLQQVGMPLAPSLQASLTPTS
jgi:hypothetical protein